MSSPLVAIVTPTYNGARYLEEAMESVQQLTYDNVVHVVLDNASTDETPAIIDKFRNRRVPVIVYRNDEVLPQRLNWNKALSLAPKEAKWVRLFADDDTVSPDSITDMVRVGESDPKIDAVGGLHHCAGEIQDFFWPKDRQVFDGHEAIRMTLMRQGVIMPIQMLWRKSAVDARDPMFQDDLDNAWDFDGVLGLLTKGKLGFTHTCVGFTRVHDHTLTYALVGLRSWTRDALDVIRKYGPDVFGDQYEAELLRFRRYYVRRMLLWRWRDGTAANLNIHKAALERAGWTFGPGLVTDAMFGWGLQKLGLYRNWRGYPGWQ